MGQMVPPSKKAASNQPSRRWPEGKDPQEELLPLASEGQAGRARLCREVGGHALSGQLQDSPSILGGQRPLAWASPCTLC